jgi:hypothetical protein
MKFFGLSVVLGVLLGVLHPAEARAQDGDSLILGFRVSVGGRYDDVRMCVATPAGVKGGMAMDISFFTEIGLKENVALLVNVPVMRPILFAAAFRMLQFEPEVMLLFRRPTDRRVDFVVGPSLGVTLHYGPDYRSEKSGDGRGPSFFAMGPKVGGFLGLDVKRPGETFNFMLALSPYVSPLFGIRDPDDHVGLVAGGSLDGLFRFSAR